MQSGNRKVLSLMQPTYLPWLGYFNLIKQSDIFVVYTTTQLTKRSWQVRNRVKTSTGSVFLTIPIRKTESRNDLLIKDALINYETDWIDKHLSTIRYAYSNAPFFAQIYEIISTVLESRPTHLTGVTVRMLTEFLSLLKIDTQVVLSENISYLGKKDEALVSICKEFGDVSYLSVQGSKDYILDGINLFEQNNIPLTWHNYNYPTYKQLYGEFVSHMGIVDALFNIGPEETSNLI
jgi:hypothetical protein